MTYCRDIACWFTDNYCARFSRKLIIFSQLLYSLTSQFFCCSENEPDSVFWDLACRNFNEAQIIAASADFISLEPRP